MRKLLNTLFVLTESSYLTLDGENVVITHSGGHPLFFLSGRFSCPNGRLCAAERRFGLFYTPRAVFGPLGRPDPRQRIASPAAISHCR